MAETDLSSGRRPGRPPIRSEAETRAMIIASAAKAFLEMGYSRTGVDTIARDVGISTRTLYRLFATKEDLLREAMEARIDEAFGALDTAGIDILDGHESLRVLLTGYAELALSDDAVRLTRLIAAEQQDVPGLAASYRQATVRITEIFDAWIRGQQERGFLREGHSELAADLLRGMLNEAQRQILLGLRQPLSREETAAWVSAAASIFLNGFAVRH